PRPACSGCRACCWAVRAPPTRGAALRAIGADRRRMEVLGKSQVCGVVIVGSGAGGGMAAEVLAEGGANCVLLEAGPMWAANKDGAMFKWPYDSPRRGGGSRLRPLGGDDGRIGGGGGGGGRAPDAGAEGRVSVRAGAPRGAVGTS